MKSRGGLVYDRYEAGSGSEWTMRIGSGPAILFLPPLFEEMNRTRSLLAATMRLAAAEGFGCHLPDLPGTGESERDLEEFGWSDWREAARAAGRDCGGPLLVVSIRGGCLIDDAVEAKGWLRLSPAEGGSLLREMKRKALPDGGAAAGYRLSDSLAEGLGAASPAEVKPLLTLRLETDPGVADRKIKGPALWRRSEPAPSPELAQALTAEIVTWARQCGA